MMNNSLNALSGKVALVTGGSRGIGAAIVRRLSHDGAAVAFTYSASEDRANALAAEIKAAGGKALPIKADSADTEAVKQAVALTAKTYGGLDILFNNSRIFKPGMIREVSLSPFSQILPPHPPPVFLP